MPRRKRERKTSESTIDQFNHRCRSVKGDIGSINRQLCLPINMAPTLGGIKRYTSPEASTPRTPLLLLGTTVASLLMGIVEGADISTTYLKPTVSSTACVGSTEQIAAKTEALGNDGACMQCDPAINVRTYPPRMCTFRPIICSAYTGILGGPITNAFRALEWKTPMKTHA